MKQLVLFLVQSVRKCSIIVLILFYFHRVVELKKPQRIELFFALIICTLLIGASIYANSSRTFTSFLSGSGTTSLKPQFGLEHSVSPEAKQLQTSVEERRRDIKHWINGELKKGMFSYVIIKIEDETEVLGGYVYSEDLMYSDGLWHGEIVSRIPQNKSARFVFKVEELITANGTVIAITTRIRDISETSSPQETPYATIWVILAEIGEKQGFELPVIPQIAPYLNTFFVWMATGVILGLPTYFTILGIVLLIDRALLPATIKLLKKRTNKAKETN